MHTLYIFQEDHSLALYYIYLFMGGGHAPQPWCEAQRTIVGVGSLLTPCGWVPGSNPGSQAWQQVTLPPELCLLPTKIIC